MSNYADTLTTLHTSLDELAEKDLAWIDDQQAGSDFRMEDYVDALVGHGMINSTSKGWYLVAGSKSLAQMAKAPRFNK